MSSPAQPTPTRSSGKHRVTEVHITPVAFRDPPLLSTAGLHQPVVLRAVVELRTDTGFTGIAETYGGQRHLLRTQALGQELVGQDISHPARVWHLLRNRWTSANISGIGGRAGMERSGNFNQVVAPFDVAIHDLLGKILEVPVHQLLGGAFRDSVEFNGYLFYHLAEHPDSQVYAEDSCLDADGIVSQAHTMVREHGFRSFKLKGGVFSPGEEAETIRALKAAFPAAAVRLDPNSAWSVETSVEVLNSLKDELEYAEDPTPGVGGMAQVRSRTHVPLATNMCVVSLEDLPAGISAGAVDIVLADHHVWGGFTPSKALFSVAETFGLRLGMHSNSHLGISLAAMVHLAAAAPHFPYPADTHWPWKDPSEDVIRPGQLTLESGRVPVPQRPGLGVDLDHERLQALNEAYKQQSFRERVDDEWMRKVDPTFSAVLPKW